MTVAFFIFTFTLTYLWLHAHGSSLVELNAGLQVARGHSAFVTAGELRIRSTGPFEACKVEVVDTEPVTQRVGKLTPQVPDEVKYVHNGSPLLEEDTVMLRVFKIQPGVVCTVRLLSSEINVPMLGQLVVEDHASVLASEAGPRIGRHTGITCPGNKACDHNTREVDFLKTDCTKFLTSGLKYQHLSPPSPEIDYIPVRVEFRDQSSRALLETENIWLPVLIQGAMQNQPPHAAFMSTFILEVDQFILTPMTTAALDAKDDETPQAQLIFNVTKPPAEGYITHLDDHTKVVSSFSWQDPA